MDPLSAAKHIRDLNIPDSYYHYWDFYNQTWHGNATEAWDGVGILTKSPPLNIYEKQWMFTSGEYKAPFFYT